MELAKQFLENGPHLYRAKHLLRDSNGWKHSNRYLKTADIEKALQGMADIGYYGASVSDCVALDLDDHHGEAWQGFTPSVRLEKLYFNVCRELSRPSLVFRSPRGLHAYYKLESLYPSNTLTQHATRKVYKYGAEVRPTMQMGLRLPRVKDRLNPETLSPIPEEGLNNIPVKFSGELFGMDHTPEMIREQIRQQTGGTKGYVIHAARIAKAEGRIIGTGLTGASNEALCHLAPIYAAAGLNVEQAVYRFLFLVQETGYTGELTNRHRLTNRMETLYHGFLENGYVQEHRQLVTVEQGLFDNAIIQTLVERAPFSIQRRDPVKRFLSGLFDWINYQDAITADPGAMAFWNYLYPYHRYNTRQGWVPIPRNLLKDLNSHYNTILAYLLETGFLTPAPFKYQVGGLNKDKTGYQAGVCKHYAINREIGLFNRE